MKHIPVLIFALLTHSLSAGEAIRERIEWMDIWVTDADKNHLPRVLLVGDSITRGYFGGVEKQLQGKAYCARLTASKCVSDPTFNADLQLLLDQYDFDVIHINNGLHGWGYSEDQYEEGLEDTVAAIKNHAPDAQVIWATTTPVRQSLDLKKYGEKTERVRTRNQIAAEIMKSNDVPTNDLYELVAEHPDWYSNDGVHFNDQGREAQAKQVAEIVEAHLPATPSP